MLRLDIPLLHEDAFDVEKEIERRKRNNICKYIFAMIVIIILNVLLSINISLSSTLYELNKREEELKLKNNLLKLDISKGDNSINNINYNDYDKIYQSKKEQLYNFQMKLMLTLKDNEKIEDELNKLKNKNEFIKKEIKSIKKIILKYSTKS